jgi:hypothetical protein
LFSIQDRIKALRWSSWSCTCKISNTQKMAYRLHWRMYFARVARVVGSSGLNSTNKLNSLHLIERLDTFAPSGAGSRKVRSTLKTQYGRFREKRPDYTTRDISSFRLFFNNPIHTCGLVSYHIWYLNFSSCNKYWI